jgi:hypothetical protein
MTIGEATALVDKYGSETWAWEGWVLDIKWSTFRKKALEMGALAGRGIIVSDWGEPSLWRFPSKKLQRYVFKRLPEDVVAVTVQEKG